MTAPLSSRKLPFEPGLEGLRGVAVVAVLFFHGGFTWASGGFLGVSTFFTLSGFLITSLLLREHAQQGSISLRRFWVRRFRRLMPASLVCLAGIVLFGATVADASQLATLRGDVLAALAYVANWHFVLDGQGYTDLFSTPSPVLHFWSLAIEEQFYVVFPLLVAAVLGLARGSRRALAAVLAVLTVGSVAASLLLYDPLDPSRVYYGTDTRAAELLLGGLLALVVASPWWRRTDGRGGASAGLAATGLAAFAAVVWLYHAASDADPWLYRGGFAAFAVLSVLVVGAATVPGPLKQVLSVRPLRWLGALSYGIYLFHWPIFLWLTQDRTGLRGWPLFGLRVAVTFAVAAVSYRWVESPVRAGRRLGGRTALVVAPAAVAVVALGVVGVTAEPPRDAQISYEIAVGEVTSATRPPGDGRTDGSAVPAPLSAPGDLAAPAAPPPGPRRVMTYGDSIAMTLVPGLAAQAEQRGDLVIINTAEVSCGTAIGGEYTVLHYVDLPSRPECDSRLEALPDLLAEHRPDEVLVLSCLYDVAARRMPGDDTYRWVGDPVYDRWLIDAMRATARALGASGARVSWLTCPYMDPVDIEDRGSGQSDRKFPERDPARVDRLNEIIREVARTEPAMRAVELGPHLESLPGGSFDPALRTDGVHFHRQGTMAIAPWLVERVFDPLQPPEPAEPAGPAGSAAPVSARPDPDR